MSDDTTAAAHMSPCSTRLRADGCLRHCMGGSGLAGALTRVLGGEASAFARAGGEARAFARVLIAAESAPGYVTGIDTVRI